jgi:2'-5' RNA ligase
VRRLFVAIDLPAKVTNVLQRVQPPPVAGLRVISAGQMAMTLHFIGQADLAIVLDALHTVRAPAFAL